MDNKRFKEIVSYIDRQLPNISNEEFSKEQAKELDLLIKDRIKKSSLFIKSIKIKKDVDS